MMCSVCFISGSERIFGRIGPVKFSKNSLCLGMSSFVRGKIVSEIGGIKLKISTSKGGRGRRSMEPMVNLWW